MKFRRKERTFEQMVKDQSKEQIFDLIIQLKCLTLVLPEYGFYTPLIDFIL